MKKTLLFVLFAIMGCQTQTKETPSLAGAYTMIVQSNTVENGLPQNSEGVQQLKVFTDQYMMYVLFNSKDSTASFGVGTYFPKPGGITEHVIFSATDSVVNTTDGIYELDIESRPDGYQQTINETNAAGKKTSSTETYRSVGSPVTSPLDGAWREIRTYNIANGDTTSFTMNQYKTYFAGHFLYGHTFEDATGTTHTGMGFGTFEMIGDTQTKEVVTVSTYGSGGRSYDIEIEFNGPNEYKQTITDENGVRNVEIYRRMEKREE